MHDSDAAESLLWNRRDLLKVGSLGLAAAALPGTTAAASSSRTASADSVIVLWMAGGLTHIDSLDPKPDAPAEIRGNLRSIPTAVPGVRFAETMPRLARQMRHLAVLRSYSHDSNDHFLSQAHALSGRKVPMSGITTEPNVGSIVAHLQGPRAGFPGYLAVPGTTRPGPPPKNLFTGGWLGGQVAPFSTGGKPRNEDFTARVAEASEEEFNQQALRLPAGMGGDRLRGPAFPARAGVDAGLRFVESSTDAATLERQYGAAYAMLTSPGVRGAFDLGAEPARLRDGYGRTKIGQRCLLARRLVEAGARFVLVDYGYDPEFGNLWDNHNAPVQNHPPIMEIVHRPWHLAGVDRAFAALIGDLHDRGLLGRTLVMLLTEFGRTPRINGNGGRDHWGAAGSLFFAGGGTRGQVIGGTDRHAARVVTAPHGPGDVAATVYQALGIDPEGTLYDRQRRPHPVLPQGRAIPGVLGG